MLGHGNWHKIIPKERHANLRFRRALLDKCKNNPAVQRAVIQACKDDLLFYVNTMVWYHNPLETGDKIVGPFCTWKFQDDALLKTLKRWIIDRKDALWEKSREMGATWMALILEDWACIFHERQKFLDISHTADAVDNGEDSDTLFWKIRFMHDHLPSWLLPKIKPRKMNIAYQHTKSIITGAASTGRSGVGGRGKVLLDELGKQQSAHDIVGQTADTGPRLFVSTHYGIGTTFYDLCERPDMWKLVFHWSVHPEKNKGLYRFNTETKEVEFLNEQYEVIEKPTYDYPRDYHFVCDGTPTGGPYPGIRSFWYDEECARRGNKRDVAIHLDINPSGADTQFFDAIKLRELRLGYCMNPKWEGDLHYDRDTGEPICLREQEGGPLKLWRLPDHQGKFPDSKYGAGADIGTGSGATPSCLSLGDAATSEKILEYADPWIKNIDFGVKAVALCRLFAGGHRAGALLAWEIQGPGVMFGESVIKCGYRNIYYRTDESPHTLNPKVSERPGWGANRNEELITQYRHGLEQRLFINRSFQAIKDCGAFRVNKMGKLEQATSVSTSDPEAARENHADLVIADALCYKMMIQLGMDRIKKEEKERVQVGSWAWRRAMTNEMIRQRDEEYA